MSWFRNFSVKNWKKSVCRKLAVHAVEELGRTDKKIRDAMKANYDKETEQLKMDCQLRVIMSEEANEEYVAERLRSVDVQESRLQDQIRSLEEEKEAFRSERENIRIKHKKLNSWIAENHDTYELAGKFVRQYQNAVSLEAEFSALEESGAVVLKGKR